LLHQARPLVGYGAWKTWIEANLGSSVTYVQASRFVRCYEFSLTEKGQTLLTLGHQFTAMVAFATVDVDVLETLIEEVEKTGRPFTGGEAQSHVAQIRKKHGQIAPGNRSRLIPFAGADDKDALHLYYDNEIRLGRKLARIAEEFATIATFEAQSDGWTFKLKRAVRVKSLSAPEGAIVAAE